MGKKKVVEKQIELKTPVVAVMGHVDHGKTSLLDAIRGTKVTDTEVGGITQSVRAHQIDYTSKDGYKTKITFIDTPGHEAFSNMRSRGAKVADIALIVVAIDDGVKPQTKEAIKFALEQKLPIIIALNKIDLPGENEMKIKTQLSKEGVNTEDLGGDAILVKTSTKTMEGIDTLLETIVLLTQVHELKFVASERPEVLAEGLVLESNLSKSLGAVALVILKKGIVNTSELYIANEKFSSKVRSAFDTNQKRIEDAKAGDPIWITGITDVLDVGQSVRFFKGKIEAEKEIETMQEEIKAVEEAIDPMDAFLKMVKESKSEGDKKILNAILKTDTRGSSEVLRSEVEKLNDEISEVKILEIKEGEITETDIMNAKNQKALIIGFRAGISDNARKLAIREKVLVRDYQIIYELIEELAAVLDGLIEPEEQDVEVARALVKKVFTLTNGDSVAGSVVQKGVMLKGYRVYVEREGHKMEKGKIKSLRLLKNEVKEATKNQECGILIDPKLDVQEGDFVIAYKVEKIG
ncbi:MAG: translation initiation factor IF-2 [bacterium]